MSRPLRQILQPVGAILILTAAFAAGRLHASAARAVPPGSPGAVVQRQLEAYNARDLDAFLATYADDAQLFEHPDKLLASGLAEMRKRYSERFAEPNLHAVITGRIVMGDFVIDHELVSRTFPEGPGTAEAVAIYEVRGGKIAKVWLILGRRKVNAK